MELFKEGRGLMRLSQEGKNVSIKGKRYERRPVVEVDGKERNKERTEGRKSRYKREDSWYMERNK